MAALALSPLNSRYCEPPLIVIISVQSSHLMETSRNPASSPGCCLHVCGPICLFRRFSVRPKSLLAIVPGFLVHPLVGLHGDTDSNCMMSVYIVCKLTVRIQQAPIRLPGLDSVSAKCTCTMHIFRLCDDVDSIYFDHGVPQDGHLHSPSFTFPPINLPRIVFYRPV